MSWRKTFLGGFSMSRDDEDDRTIFGQKLPEPSPRVPPSQAVVSDQAEDETVFGRPDPERTRRPPPPPSSPTHGKPLSDVQLQDVAPRTPTTDKSSPRSGINPGQASNPILAAASDLLVLLGQLRTGQVDMQTMPLRDCLLREIQSFVATAHGTGVSPEDIELACYALTATADDIAKTIPGIDLTYWQQHPLSTVLLNDPMSGIGFFVRLDKVLAQLPRRTHVLEVMLTCLALGFEGQYRHQRKGAIALTQLRKETYQQLRAVVPHPGQDLSVRWAPILMGGPRQTERLPLWVFCGVAACMALIFFATLSGILSSEVQASQRIILALHDPNQKVTLQIRAGEVTSAPYVAPIPAQLTRIRRLLSSEIDSDQIRVEIKGDFIALRVGSHLRFKSSSADLNSDFTPLAQRLGRVLEAEDMGGVIIIEGHSDNIQMNGRGRYKTNEELSLARAKTVMGVLAGFVSSTTRLTAVGVGPNDPLDTADTPKARQMNRRVEILLAREEPL